MRYSGWLGISLALMTLALSLACSGLGGGVRLRDQIDSRGWAFQDENGVVLSAGFRGVERVSENVFLAETYTYGGGHKIVTVRGKTVQVEEDPYRAGCDEVEGSPGPERYFGCKQGELWGIRQGTREVVKATYESLSGDFELGLLLVDEKRVLDLKGNTRFDLPEADGWGDHDGWILGGQANGLRSVWDKGGSKVAEARYVQVLNEEYVLLCSQSPYDTDNFYYAGQNPFDGTYHYPLEQYAPRVVSHSGKPVSLPFFPLFSIGDLWITGAPSQLVTSEGEVRFAVQSGVLRPDGPDRLIWVPDPLSSEGKLMNLEGKLLSNDRLLAEEYDICSISSTLEVNPDRWLAAMDEGTGQWGYIDRDGNRVLGFHQGWTACYPFHGEFAVVRTDEYRMLIDREGEEMVFR